MLSAVLLFVTKVLVLDLYLIEKVLDVLDVFQVLWLFVLVLVLANMKNTCTWLKYFEKYLTPTLVMMKFESCMCMGLVVYVNGWDWMILDIWPTGEFTLHCSVWKIIYFLKYVNLMA